MNHLFRPADRPHNDRKYIIFVELMQEVFSVLLFFSFPPFAPFPSVLHNPGQPAI
jgi:hypothetical protein